MHVAHLKGVDGPHHAVPHLCAPMQLRLAASLSGCSTLGPRCAGSSQAGVSAAGSMLCIPQQQQQRSATQA